MIVKSLANRRNHQPLLLAALLVLIWILTACQSGTPVTPTQGPTLQHEPTLVTAEPAQTSMPPTVDPTATVTIAVETPAVYDPAVADSWKDLPVIPESLSQRVHDLYNNGKVSGLDQDAFSKAGDCETSTEYFLAPFDLKESGYRLGEYSSLKTVILKYEGSFERRSLAAKSSFSVAHALSPVWADAAFCKSGESPIVCEIRIHRPSIMLVMFGTNDVNTSSRAQFEINLRRLLDITIANNVVPVLVTKADNLEGDGSINAIIARVAYEYDIPLMNFWRAMQEIPGGGLKPDQIHLTYAQPFFDSPENMQMGWPVRNLTALQMLAFLDEQLAP
jgi:hypothetical protein